MANCTSGTGYTNEIYTDVVFTATRNYYSWDVSPVLGTVCKDPAEITVTPLSVPLYLLAQIIKAQYEAGVTGAPGDPFIYIVGGAY